MTEEITPKDARQGRSKPNVLIILVVSLVLALIAFGVFQLISG